MNDGYDLNLFDASEPLLIGELLLVTANNRPLEYLLSPE